MTALHINDDFSQSVALHAANAGWQASPQSGVTRRMLDRTGGEVARATSVVRYAPASRFPSHVHGGGEEIFVLEGVFGDEHGAYPAGCYLRNPIGSRHAPFSKPGCLLFVKLRQFEPADTRSCVVDTTQGAWQRGVQAGIEVQALHRFGSEAVTLERWAAETNCQRCVPDGGEEIYLLSGEMRIDGVDCCAGSWLRWPAGVEMDWHCEADGLLYRKTGHLPSG